MDDPPTIQFVFTNSKPGRFSGERGIYTKTVLEFADRDGRIAPLARKLTALEATKEGALSRILAGKNYFSRILLLLQNHFVVGKVERLHNKVRQRMLRLLCGNLEGLHLRLISGNTNRPVESYQAQELASNLQLATNQWLWVTEPV